MKNQYHIKGKIAVIDIPYKKNTLQVTIDTDDLPLVSSYEGTWISKVGRTGHDIRFHLNTDKTLYMHRLIARAQKGDIVYFKDKNHCHLTKSNLSLNNYEMDEEHKERRKEIYRNMSEEAWKNIVKGMRENRYSKDYSDQLSITKKGEKNAASKLNRVAVMRIREEYEKKNVSQQALADAYKVARTTIADVANYRTWNEIGEDKDKDKDKVYRVYNEERVVAYHPPLTNEAYIPFANEHIAKDEFILQTTIQGQEEKLFIQKIGDIKLYVEVRGANKEFKHNFEVVFPENINHRHKHNYVICQRKPVKGKTGEDIHRYMTVISHFLRSDQKNRL